MASVPGGDVSRRAVLAAVAAFLALAAPTFASAQAMPDISGVDQYVEPLPTGGGNQPAGAGGGSASPGNAPSAGSGPATSINPAVDAQIAQEGENDAATLSAIASDPRFGAPREPIKNSRARRIRGEESASGETGAGVSRPDVSLGEAVSSGVGALAGGDGDRGTNGLLVALVAVSLVIGGFAVWRSRRRSA